MARPTTVVLLLMILLASLWSCLEARKLVVENQQNKVNPSSRRDSLFLSALPKGTVPPSSPSKKGHATEVDEKLISRHLITIDRVLLRSVPSPGVGH
ncbi:hypothetical protein LR48_Vigan01g043200 [Vigna angularis]|uniref:Precursor of CEP14 n=2 Tax=Phaseolus angularis TaxID=3914 RepID=A0A0L9TKA5_PHAAN|nr:hypothetical protein HKW66_Vig0009590 [Vigna angularis]KOM30877.1 hypothetical protein LR48_Vigan01g043200 [Vigna angularis]BAT73599.1 hypothetical protein VIGAN_01110100 [Vigna angularis var. angularis]